MRATLTFMKFRMRGNLDKQKYISRSVHFIREHPAGPFSEHIHVLQPSREIYQSPGSCCLPRLSKQRSTGTAPVLKLLIKSVSNDKLKKRHLLYKVKFSSTESNFCNASN